MDRGGFTRANSETERTRSESRAGKCIDVLRESKSRRIGGGVVSDLLWFERQVIRISNGIGCVEKLIEVWVLDTASHWKAVRVVFNVELFAIEVDNDGISSLLKHSCGIANHGLWNNRCYFGTEIQTELDGVLTRVRIARLEQITIGISQPGDSSSRIIKSKNFQAIDVIR